MAAKWDPTEPATFHIVWRKEKLPVLVIGRGHNLKNTDVANCDQVCNVMQVQGPLKLSISLGYSTNVIQYAVMSAWHVNCKSNIVSQNLVGGMHLSIYTLQSHTYLESKLPRMPDGNPSI